MNSRQTPFVRILVAGLLLIQSLYPAYAGNQHIQLVVDYKVVDFAGKPTKAIAVNNEVPGPTLRFNEGDRVTITVTNHLKEETAIHWHGLLVPWQMDGVLGVSQQGIQPGKSFTYQFTIHQQGTYWYHAHAGLQEQQGLYGGLIINPKKAPPFYYNKDYVIVLSDWVNTNPDNVLANLKKAGDYYAPRFPLQPSLAKFIHDYRQASLTERSQLLNDYQTMQRSRMGIYDISDVAYDAFLLNGTTKNHPWTAPVNVGDIVRLRFIGATGGTIYHVKIPGTIMQMVHVQGNNINPYPIDNFSIAPGETYDVLVKITQPQPYIIYAESADTLGAAYGALLTNPAQAAPYSSVTPFPEPLPVTREMNANMMHGDHAANHETAIATPSQHQNSSHQMMHDMGSHNMGSHNMHVPAQQEHRPQAAMQTMHMATEPEIIQDQWLPPTTAYQTSPTTKYAAMRGAVKTNDPNKPIAEVINLELFGYMDRFIWFINGTPGYLAKPITLDPGKRYRFVMINHSMMHHPMHLHGHWFILRKGDGAYDPLLHTIDIPAGATMTADVDTDASGQWFFHCHMLFHMMSGMSRVFQYSTLLEVTEGKLPPANIVKNTRYVNRPIVRVDEARPINPALVMHPMAHGASMWFATELDVGINPVTNFQKITYKGLYGKDYNKLELFTNDAEISHGKVENADIDVFYWHLLDQFWALKGGVNYFYRPASSPYWQPGIGIEGTAPYFIDVDLRGYYYSGSAKADIELTRDIQLTNNFFLRAAVRSILASKTIPAAEIGSGLNQMQYTLRPFYRIMPGINLFMEFEREKYYGKFKIFQNNNGQSTIQNNLTLGFDILF